MGKHSFFRKSILLCLYGLLIALFNIRQVDAKERSPIKVYVDAVRIQFAVEPIIEKGTTLVQLRPLFEALDIELTWDGANRLVTGKKPGLTFELRIDSTEATVNGSKVELAKAARIINGNTIVPLRFIGEATGALVHWDGEYREIVIITEQLLEYYGLTKEEAERMLQEPAPSTPFSASHSVSPLQGMYYSMSLDIANYCGGGFCFDFYTFFPDGKVFIGEPQTGGAETIDCTQIACSDYIVEGNLIVFDQSLQAYYEKTEYGTVVIGDKELSPVQPLAKQMKLNGLYEHISTYGSTLGNAMIAGKLLLRSDGSYETNKLLMGTDFNYTLEQGGYASDSSDSGAYEIMGNSLILHNANGQRAALFMMDMTDNGSMEYLFIGGRIYKHNNLAIEE